ncbi:hypothetical protein BSIN_5015 [Burkholderia singularis]|uniref:Uncharacterized protein n=1 Tax=Burkholderia singularis TaxID=1503053 RepID=A0A238HBH9_9BURK|nr:hypothetical protein BSIN_5015 [Burkholderia singularis]
MAVDDMMMEMGSAADYKANRRRAGSLCSAFAGILAVWPMRVMHAHTGFGGLL